MSEQTAGGQELEQLPRLLEDIVADLESALNNARNAPAKKLLRTRIARVRRALDEMAGTAAEPANDGRLVSECSEPRIKI